MATLLRCIFDLFAFNFSRTGPEMEIELAAIADYALVDQRGKMSVLGIFDVVGAPKFPVIHPNLFVCLRIACRPIEFGTEHRIAIILQDQDGQRLGPRIEAPFTAPRPPYANAHKSAVQLVLGMTGLRFERPGTFSFELAIDGNHRQSIPLQVVAAEQAPPAT